MNNPHIWNEIDVIYKVISVDSNGLETSLPVRLQHPLKLCVRPYIKALCEALQRPEIKVKWTQQW